MHRLVDFFETRTLLQGLAGLRVEVVQIVLLHVGFRQAIAKRFFEFVQMRRLTEEKDRRRFPRRVQRQTQVQTLAGGNRVRDAAPLVLQFTGDRHAENVDGRVGRRVRSLLGRGWRTLSRLLLLRVVGRFAVVVRRRVDPEGRRESSSQLKFRRAVFEIFRRREEKARRRFFVRLRLRRIWIFCRTKTNRVESTGERFVLPNLIRSKPAVFRMSRKRRQTGFCR